METCTNGERLTLLFAVINFSPEIATWALHFRFSLDKTDTLGSRLESNIGGTVPAESIVSRH